MQKRMEMGVMIHSVPFPMLVVKLEGEDRLRVLTVLTEEKVDESSVATWIKQGSVESPEPKPA